MDYGRDVLETDSHLEIVASRLVILAGSQDANIPTVIDQLLSLVGIVDEDAEVALSGAVLLALVTGEVPEEKAGIFDHDVVNILISH